MAGTDSWVCVGCGTAIRLGSVLSSVNLCPDALLAESVAFETPRAIELDIAFDWCSVRCFHRWLYRACAAMSATPRTAQEGALILMKVTQVTAGFGLTVATPNYGAARVYREYTATVARNENAVAVEGQLEEMARESVLAFIASEPWNVERPRPPEPEREHRVISSFDPEAA